MTKQYKVQRGGRPSKEANYFDTLDVAKTYAMDQAIQQAEAEGLDAKKLDEYGDGPHTGWDVCPENDNGAFWVFITDMLYCPMCDESPCQCGDGDHGNNDSN